MITENLSTLKIHNLTKEQYERELAAGRIDESALYLTPYEEQVQSDWFQTDETAADYIKNKPKAVKTINGITPDDDGSVTIKTGENWVDPEIDEYFGEGEVADGNKVSYARENLIGYFDFIGVEDNYAGEIANKCPDANSGMFAAVRTLNGHPTKTTQLGIRSGVLRAGREPLGAYSASAYMQIYNSESRRLVSAYPYTIEFYSKVRGDFNGGEEQDINSSGAGLVTTRAGIADEAKQLNLISTSHSGISVFVNSDAHTLTTFGATGSGNNTIALPETYVINEYHHYVVVVDSALVRIYIDGVLVGEGTARNNTTVSETETCCHFGYSGDIKMVRVYNAILTDEQVANNYQDAIANYYDIKKYDITYKPIKEMDNFPVTLASATYMNDSNTTVEAEIKALKRGGTYVIKGLTEMELHLPPFTEDEYAIAYNNGLIIHNSIQENCDTYKSFIIPKGTYPVCYQYNDGTERENYIFNLADGVKLDMQCSELWVMYDSDNKSPYDNRTDTTIYKFGGNVVGLSYVRDVEICNGKITGERELRSFTDTAENRVESTTGICMIKCCVNVHIHDMDINSFMADSISANSIYGDKGGYYESAAITMENLNNDGTIGSASAIWGHTDMTEIPPECIGVPTYIWTGIGYNYVMSNHFGMFIYLYDDEETFITSFAVDQCEPFVIKEYLGATKYRLYIGIGTSLTSIAYRMTTECSNKILIEDCKFTNNQRGGISNMPISTVIQRCMFDNCGSTSYGGKPPFYDSTKYFIDIEDIASQDLTVRDCKFTNGFHGILSGAINAVYDNNTFINVAYDSISIYRGKYIKIVNNRFYNCNFPKPTSGSDASAWNATKVVVANNSGVFNGGVTFVDGWTYSNNQCVAKGIINKGKTEVNVGHSANIADYIEGKLSGQIDLFNSVYVNNPLTSVDGLYLNCRNGSVFKYANAGHIKNIVINNSTDGGIYYYNDSLAKESLVVDDCIINALEGKVCTVQHYATIFKNVTLNNCILNLSGMWYNFVFDNTNCNTNLTFNNCTLNWTGITENTSFFEIGVDKPANIVTFNNCKFTNDSTEFTVTIKSNNPNAIYAFNNCIADDTVILE